MRKTNKQVSTEHLCWTNVMFPLIVASKMVVLSFCYLEATIMWLTLNKRVFETSQTRKRDESTRTQMLLYINLRQWEHRRKHCLIHDFLGTSDRSAKAVREHWGSGERCRCPLANQNLGKGNSDQDISWVLREVLIVLFYRLSFLLCKTEKIDIIFTFSNKEIQIWQRYLTF